MEKKYQIAVVGGGPGGYVAALRASQLRKKVVLIEKEKIGGTCMNWGCIPTKYLLQQTKILEEIKKNTKLEGPLDKIHLNWEKVQKGKELLVERLVKGVEFLLQRNGVDVIKGKARLTQEKRLIVEVKGEKMSLDAEKVILALGSRPAELPFLKPEGRMVLTSREALELEEIPRSLLVVGAGAIGLELGTIFSRLGTEVTVLEIMPTILPGSDREMVTRLERILKRQGLKIFTEMKIEECFKAEQKVFLRGVCSKSEEKFEFEAEKVLLAVGRKPNSEEILEEISRDERGFIKVNEKLETSYSGVYAVGDLIGKGLLAHKASHEGVIAAENACGLRGSMEYNAIPMAVYTEPEFSSVGLSEEEALEKGVKIKTGIFSLQANGRALTMEKSEGIVKVVADEKDRILGAQILSPLASELISELTLAIKNRLRLKDIFSTVHVHPTLAEAVMEASMSANKRALHILNE